MGSSKAALVGVFTTYSPGRGCESTSLHPFTSTWCQNSCLRTGLRDQFTDPYTPCALCPMLRAITAWARAVEPNILRPLRRCWHFNPLRYVTAVGRLCAVVIAFPRTMGFGPAQSRFSAIETTRDTWRTVVKTYLICHRFRAQNPW